MGQEGHISGKLTQQAVNFAILDLDYEALGAIITLSGDDKITISEAIKTVSQLKRKILTIANILTSSDLLIHSEEDLHGVHSIAQVMLAHVNGLLLDYLLLLLCAIGTESLCIVTTVACVASLLEKGLVTVGCAVLFLDNEVRWTALVCATFLPRRRHHCLLLFLLVSKLVRELTDIFEHLSSLEVILGPLGHVVVWFLLLETLQDNLVLPGDLH